MFRFSRIDSIPCSSTPNLTIQRSDSRNHKNPQVSAQMTRSKPHDLRSRT
ncbi:hypothetical protein Syun_012411 [Stephania yunnanensis]|uniref:Uncharacterized protein n=1 Tax=Stephania yunnanensis TaxID=152371 RepID=A0AAP0JZK8_9MAGN